MGLTYFCCLRGPHGVIDPLMEDLVCLGRLDYHRFHPLQWHIVLRGIAGQRLTLLLNDVNLRGKGTKVSRRRRSIDERGTHHDHQLLDNFLLHADREVRQFEIKRGD